MNTEPNGSPGGTPVTVIKKVGPRRAEQLARLNIHTVHDLLYHFPREYVDRRQLDSLSEQVGGAEVTVLGRVADVRESRPRRNLIVTRATMEGGEGAFQAVWFNQRQVKKCLQPGAELLVSGKLRGESGSLQILVHDFELVSDSETLLHAGRLVPIYPATSGITQRMLRKYAFEALYRWQEKYREFLPQWLTRSEKLVELPGALSQVHFPDDRSQAERARRRFIFEELFLFQLRLALLRGRCARVEKQHRYLDGGLLRRKYLTNLDFDLTTAQRRVSDEIQQDLERLQPMNRLLQGDVGSGKTVVAVLTLLRAVESGLQGALMAPTEVLAEQHFISLSEALNPLGIRTVLLSGGMSLKERRDVLEGLATGEIPIVVGTHALLQGDVAFKNLAVVVIDEQHRFGVKQRAALQEKGVRPDVLVMTATPIPRTLTLTVYGDLDVSVIDKMPPGRQPVRTYFVAPKELPNVFKFVAGQLAAGCQAYVVCPLVEESEKIDLQAAGELYHKLVGNELSQFKVALLHGRMKRDEKEQVMRDFRSGTVQALVSTTVIEVGVDVPNASVMVIIDADRFGLAQLHQLRGRVGRGPGQAHCILAAQLRSREAAQRIKAMKESQDGFYLAEKDLEIRGPGDMAGVKQSGLPEFRLADLLRDREIITAARRCALELVEKDPDLMSDEHLPLRFYLQRNSNNDGYFHVG